MKAYHKWMALALIFGVSALAAASAVTSIEEAMVASISYSNHDALTGIFF